MTKAKTTPTLVTFLLDKSGSMSSILPATIEGYNAYRSELLKSPDTTLSLLQFDTYDVETTFKNTEVSKTPELSAANFVPRGGTPLIDAAYKTIMAVEAAVAGRDDSPKVIICIQTDGQENASHEHTWEDLNDLIKEKIALGWQFNFLGASIDAYKQAQAMGISDINTMSYSADSLDATRSAFMASGKNTAMFASGAAASTGYSMGQRSAAKDKFIPDGLKAKKPEPKKAIVGDIKL